MVTRNEVQALREKVQELWGLSEGQAKGKAAELVHGSLRAWQNWELGARQMPESSRELLEIKLGRRKATNQRRERNHGL